jgi:hypothetical protein
LGTAHPRRPVAAVSGVGPTTTFARVAAQRSQAALADKLRAGPRGTGGGAGVSPMLEARTAH